MNNMMKIRCFSEIKNQKFNDEGYKTLSSKEQVFFFKFFLMIFFINLNRYKLIVI